MVCGPNVLPGKTELDSAHLVRQYQCSSLYKSYGRNEVITFSTAGNPILDMGSTEENHVTSQTHRRIRESNRRQDVSTDSQRQNGLAAESGSIFSYIQPVGTSSCGHVRDSVVSIPSEILFVEAGASNRGNRCLSLGLVSSPRVCQSSMVPNSTLSEESGAAESYSSDSHTPMVNSVFVSDVAVNVCRSSSCPTTNTRPLAPHSQCSRPVSESANSANLLAISGDCSLIDAYHNRL